MARWDLIGLGALAGVSGIYQARAGEAAAGAVQRTGIASSIETARQAKRVEALIPAIRLQGLQVHNEIIRSFKDISDTTQAMASYMGRDDRSVQAIQKRQMENTAKELSRVELQQKMEIAKVSRESADLTNKAIMDRISADAQAKLMRSQSRASTYGTAASLFASMI